MAGILTYQEITVLRAALMMEDEKNAHFYDRTDKKNVKTFKSNKELIMKEIERLELLQDPQNSRQIQILTNIIKQDPHVVNINSIVN